MDYTDRYAQFLLEAIPEADLDILSPVETITEKTNWDEPSTPIDLNNLGVMALIESEFAETQEEKLFYFNLAFDYLSQSTEHPLGFMHMAIALVLIDEKTSALSKSYGYLLETFQSDLGKGEVIPAGLIFLPPSLRQGLPQILAETNGFSQFQLVLGMVLPEMVLAFYVNNRWLLLANNLCPQSCAILLKLGLCNPHVNQIESLWYLHQAQRQEPHNSSVIQSLFLAYKNFQKPIESQYWLSMGKDFYLPTDPGNLAWQWTSLPEASPFTYVPFQTNILLAVLPALTQIVTIVLLADGDWFESEMEFWVSQIQPGMTVIDVGANVGVYTFSAAREVGHGGCVIAIEPFAPCVTCLQETKRVNNFSQVRIHEAAASNRSGVLRLGTAVSSEINSIVTDENSDAPSVEVAAFTLDRLLETEQLTQVDILKIDAEGHEMEVLQGSERLLSEHNPLIMYENISANQSNTDVAIYLQARGYQLYRYRPFLRQMLPIENLDQLNGVLNVIARRV